MNWLARLEVDAETVRAAGISEDVYAWHKLLWECYPDQPEAERDFLTRIDQLEGAYRFWVLAKRKPVMPRWCPVDGFGLNEISPSFLSRQYYAFDLRANPVRAAVQRDANGEQVLDANGKRRRGKRVPLVKPDELRAWLVRKGEVRCRDKETGLDVPGGFRLVEERSLEISPMVESHFRKKGQSGYHGGVQFRGTLEVTDRAKFIESYQSGIGSAKGFGFGLLLLAPANL
ncbi:type I-E CRISPR-associated protein Cas6/Cse3/CasE [Geotalea uraniireducens]|uniref:CRISPR-associated protein, Cse3 family n=1 Tax=Geotalea uraniireducens (strain Rf4) TaxID=351605 RepID=A5GBK0_GEOUR|nr:type I-E CRISPR-associated protein Cas6/Cse3/CasE [Geotalea uraniireducens]ABQ25037.1 CRISPR-associated protein, Cse3 family [Geotalea uraniireducens Rf4]